MFAPQWLIHFERVWIILEEDNDSKLSNKYVQDSRVQISKKRFYTFTLKKISTFFRQKNKNF